MVSNSKPVIVLHGLKRSAWAMRKIAKRLSAEGYDVCNVNYPSSKAPVGDLLQHIVTEIDQCYDGMPPSADYVSHSLGGIMIRALHASGQGPSIDRAVMLGPPNHGSELVDVHRNSALFKFIMGPIASYLGTDPGSLPIRLGPATFDVGIIAGTGKSNPLGAWVFDEPSDGTVSVASTKLEGMNDFIEVPYGHSFIMIRKTVINEVVHYLESGQFSDQFKH